MLSEVQKNAKADPTGKEPASKKMILVARDYVHYLRIRERSNNAQDYAKVDNVSVPIPSMAQLLASLRDDLRCATTIFLEEFIECGGVECVLDILRANLFQQSQGSQAKLKQQQAALRKSLVEQYDCLMCLKYASKSTKTLKRLTGDAHGVSSITSCIMSSATKTRILALELLCRVVDCCSGGHTLILEALTANRVLFGEPLRFKFLVGMLHANFTDKPDFQRAILKFLNAVLRTSSKPSGRIRLQCELEEAGLDITALEAALRRQSVASIDPIWEEISTWRNTYLDMENVTGQHHNLQSENEKLHKEVQLLRQALQKLEEDKINLMQIEMELKEKCDDLHDEVITLKTEMGHSKLTTEKLKEPKFRPPFTFEEEEEDLFHSSIDSGHLETEEIFIDVPTIRPPIEFCGDSNFDTLQRSCTSLDESSKSQDKKLLVPNQNASATSKPMINSAHSSDKESADSALSESESDSGINWNYPQLPAENVVRTGRHRNKFGPEDIPSIFQNSNSRKLQRSQSEDRRDSNGDIQGETKVAESMGFFMKKRQETNSRPCSQTAKESFSNVMPSYQLPIAYRSNFLTRGHSNCDLYSGITTPEPPIPPPDYGLRSYYSVGNSGGTISALVHREITKAVRQISGWI